MAMRQGLLLPRRWRSMLCVMPTQQARVPRIDARPGLPGPQDPGWSQAPPLLIDHFRPEGSAHRPRTSLQLLHDNQSFYGLFVVRDRYVRCTHQAYGEPVYQDSCVELFLQPKPERGYFNFEFNCGGAFLCMHITNPERGPDGFKEFEKVPAAIGQTIQVRPSLPRRVDPEITTPVVWTLSFFIPLALFEHYLGPLGALAGQVWRGNFFKCADETSHPHWASWSPVDALNFHLPRCFGALRFEA